jgi:hypothetical protein
LVGATAAILLLLLLGFLAADTHAHEAIHDDAHHPEHECVITLFAQGHLIELSAPTAVADVPDALFVAALNSPSPVRSTRRYWLPPSCGPPAAV